MLPSPRMLDGSSFFRRRTEGLKILRGTFSGGIGLEDMEMNFNHDFPCRRYWPGVSVSTTKQTHHAPWRASSQLQDTRCDGCQTSSTKGGASHRNIRGIHNTGLSAT